jgi:hypothetical protein
MSGNTENLIKRTLTQDYPTNYTIPGHHQHIEYNTLKEGVCVSLVKKRYKIFC